jgi:hypothetical protein
LNPEIGRRQGYAIVIAFRNAGEYQHQYSVLDLPMVLKESAYDDSLVMPIW